MNCGDYLNLLQQSLDGFPVPAESGLEAHLRECPACASRFAAARRLSAGLRLQPAPVPPPALASRIASAAVVDYRRRVMRRRVLWGALAASVVFGLGVRFAFTPGGQPPAENEMVKVAPATPQPAVLPPSPKQNLAPLRDTVAQAREAVASLTSRTASEAMGRTRLLLPSVPSQSLAKLEIPPADTPAKPLREAGENFTASLGPVTNSARRAVDLFLRDIPPVGGQGRGGL